ncbi:MAG: restriction endonuclease subunit S [Cyanobacteria bacterium P01_E01_bin.42]
MGDFPRYERYKESGVEWLGEIPEHWNILKNKFLFKEKKETVGSNSNKFILLSLTLNGVIARDMDNPQGKFPAEFNTYKIVEPNNLIFCLFDIEETPRTVGHSEQRGMITGAYDIFECNSKIYSRYIYYYYLYLDFNKRLQPLYTGLRKVIKRDSFLSIKSPVPPFEEQKKIADFLDRKTLEIENAIAKKQRLIELLEEQKTILINQAVTKGLNPDVPMKDSGIDWIGEIPEHWEIKRAKYIFKQIDERSETGQEELLSVSHITGVTPRSEKNVSMFMAEDYTGSKICKKDDLVMNIMWAWMGALGISPQTGIVSSSYGVFRHKTTNQLNSWYIENLLRSTEYIAEYNRRSTGLRSSRLRLYPDVFLDMVISLPSKNEQDRIEKIIKKQTKMIDNVVKTIETEIEKLNELKQILISQAVTGKIKI